MNKLYPIYVILFNNNTNLSKLIKKTTGSEYSHATISLDPSLNEMYSFTGIPYANRTGFGMPPAGLIRESVYGPMYSTNIFFTVLITFVDENGYNEIKNKIDYFIQNHSKYRYNDIGLIKYFFNIRTTKMPNENKKKKWFCSEFVSYLLKVGGKPGLDSIMKSPQDLYNSNLYVESVDYTLKSFSEKDLVSKTKKAEKEFIKNMNNKKISMESCIDFFENEYVAMEVSNIFKSIIENRRKEWSLMEYTALLDWKYLHNQFIKYFGSINLDKKFKIIEMIIRKNLNSNTMDNITEKIIDGFSEISSNIKKSKIMDIHDDAISFIKNGKRSTFTYSLESFNNIEIYTKYLI